MAKQAAQRANTKAAREALKAILGQLEVAARELAIASRIVRTQTKSFGGEGVLALEVSDVAHRVRDLKREGPAKEPAKSTQPGVQDRAEPSIETLLSRLDAACKALGLAAGEVGRFVEARTPGEEGVLVEEVIDVTHRTESRRDDRRLERDSRTGDFFDPPPADSGEGGFLKRLFGR